MSERDGDIETLMSDQENDEENDEENEEEFDDSDYLLITAAKDGDIETVISCINSGVNIHLVNEEALFRAVEGGHIEIVRLLLDHGADVNAKYNNMIIKWSFRRRNFELIELLLDHGADIQAALVYAIDIGKLDIVEFLIEKGAELDSVPKKLYNAIRTRNIELVNFILDYGFDTNEYPQALIEALTQALYDHNYELGKFLIDKGADINKIKINNSKRSIYHINIDDIYSYLVNYQKYKNIMEDINEEIKALPPLSKYHEGGINFQEGNINYQKELERLNSRRFSYRRKKCRRNSQI